MHFKRHPAVFLMLCILTCGAAAQEAETPDYVPHPPSAKAARHSKIGLIGLDDGLAIITAALDARTRLSPRIDCSHLVHEIYERAGFAYDYASSSDLYAGTDDFRRVSHPQPGDLVAWPGHVGIVVNPAQRSFYSALTSGLGVEDYNSPYWRERGHAHFLRFLKTHSAVERAGNSRVIR